MKRFVHFSCRPGSGGFELTYRQDGCWIRHDHIASHRSLFPDIESIEASLAAAGLQSSIASWNREGPYEVTGRQLQQLGFPMDESTL